MDAAMILDHLEKAERHVVQGAEHVTKQRALIEELRHDGHDTEAAEKLLAEFEDVQALHVADLERLRGELAQLEKPRHDVR